MRNIVPARSLARRSRNLMLGAILLVALGAVGIVVSMFLDTVPLEVANTPNFTLYQFTVGALWWIGILSIIIGVGLVIRALTWKRDNPIAAQIGDVLARELNLDDRYVYIRNLSRMAIGYVDAVLIGPPGVLVMRVTNRGGTFFNEGSKWLQQVNEGNWKPLSWSPTEEVADDVEKIREFLQARNLSQIPVFAVVVFTEDQPATRVTTESPVVPVLQPQEMTYGLDHTYFAEHSRLDQPTVNKVIKTLFG